MPQNHFSEGVKPGGLTASTEIRILLCYLLDSINAPVSRAQLEEALLGEELVNYFAMAESLAQLLEQGLITGDETGYAITGSGRTVGQTLARDVPKTVRDSAIRSVIRAVRYAAKAATNKSAIEQIDGRRTVACSIEDSTGSLFSLGLYMPDDLTAERVQQSFIEKGDEVYKLVLAALTGNKELAEDAIGKIGMDD